MNEFMNEWMSGELISITTNDKSAMLHTTGQEDENKHVLTTAGIHIMVNSFEMSSAVFEMAGFEIGLNNIYLTTITIQNI